jgi:hypothetical protein
VYRDGAICFIAVNKISHQRFDVAVEDEPDDFRIAVDYRGAGIAARDVVGRDEINGPILSDYPSPRQLHGTI